MTPNLSAKVDREDSSVSRAKVQCRVIFDETPRVWGIEMNNNGCYRLQMGDIVLDACLGASRQQGRGLRTLPFQQQRPLRRLPRCLDTWISTEPCPMSAELAT